MPDEIIVRQDSRFPTVTAWQQVSAMAEVLKDSKALPNSIQNQAQLAMVLLAGKESGMGAMESLNAYYIVNGKLTIYGQATLVQLKRAGFKVKWGECDATKATVTIVSPDGMESTETYTMAEAVKTGQTAKDPWQKHPKSMLRWKALAANIRFNCPEVLCGYFVKEDLEPTADEAKSIEATITEPTATYPPVSDSPIIDNIVPDHNPNRNHA